MASSDGASAASEDQSPPPPPTTTTTTTTIPHDDCDDRIDVLIVGAGPTGLGAAVRLHQLSILASSASGGGGDDDDEFEDHGTPDRSPAYLLVDSSPQPGGLACTVETPQGFLFDLGGHVLFSHYEYFDDLIQCAVGPFEDGEVWSRHERVSYVRMSCTSSYDDDDDDVDEDGEGGGGGGEDDGRRRGCLVRYPFQLHFGECSDPNVVVDCLRGLIDASVERRAATASASAAASASSTNAANAATLEGENATTDSTMTKAQPQQPAAKPQPQTTFDEWILRSMGHGIHRHFMSPYNFKVWAYPPTDMGSGWLGERVAEVDLDRALRNCLCAAEDRGRRRAHAAVVAAALNGDGDDGDGNADGSGAAAAAGFGGVGGGCEERDGSKGGWGPNATFVFPQRGGTGSIWKAVAEKVVPKERQRYGATMTGLDLDLRVATFEDGSKIHYNYLINTAPLDQTLRLVGRHDLASRLRYSSTHVIGLGIRGKNPHGQKCWLYYPHDDCPFYRCTIFSHYGVGNVPKEDVLLPTLFRAADAPTTVPTENDKNGGESTLRPGPYHSLMFEVSSSVEHKPVNGETIVAETIRGAINVDLLASGGEVVSVFHRRLERGYPTPHLDRDAVLDEALPYLKQRGRVWNRGRFGCWKYEVSNQDHSVMLGVEAVDNILLGKPEVTLESPNAINGKGKKRSETSFELPVGTIT